MSKRHFVSTLRDYLNDLGISNETFDKLIDEPFTKDNCYKLINENVLLQLGLKRNDINNEKIVEESINNIDLNHLNESIDDYELVINYDEKDLVQVYDEININQNGTLNDFDNYLNGSTKYDPNKMLDSFYNAFNRKIENGVETSDKLSKKNIEIGLLVYRRLTEQYNKHGLFGKIWGYISSSTKNERKALNAIENFFDKKGVSKNTLKAYSKNRNYKNEIENIVNKHLKDSEKIESNQKETQKIDYLNDEFEVNNLDINVNNVEKGSKDMTENFQKNLMN